MNKDITKWSTEKGLIQKFLLFLLHLSSGLSCYFNAQHLLLSPIIYQMRPLDGRTYVIDFQLHQIDICFSLYLFYIALYDSH